METALTAPAALLQHLELTAYCRPCRVGRPVDLMALAVARPDTPLRAMKFRCQACGSTDAEIVLAIAPGHEGHGDGERWRQG